MLDVYAVDISNVEAEVISKYCHGFSKHLKQKLSKIKNREAFIRSAFSWLLFYRLATKYDYDPLTVKYGCHGKPYLNNGLHFNMSHSKKWVVIGFSDHPVGIDIECKNVQISKALLACLEKKEAQWLTTQKDYPSQKVFKYFWSAKEAWLKYLGVGLTCFEATPFITTEKNTEALMLYQKTFDDAVLSLYARKDEMNLMMIQGVLFEENAS